MARFRLRHAHYIDGRYLLAGTEIGDGTDYNFYSPTPEMVGVDDEGRKIMEDYLSNLDNTIDPVGALSMTVLGSETVDKSRMLPIPGLRRAPASEYVPKGGPGAGKGLVVEETAIEGRRPVAFAGPARVPGEHVAVASGGPVTAPQMVGGPDGTQMIHPLSGEIVPIPTDARTKEEMDAAQAQAKADAKTRSDAAAKKAADDRAAKK